MRILLLALALSCCECFLHTSSLGRLGRAFHLKAHDALTHKASFRARHLHHRTARLGTFRLLSTASDAPGVETEEERRARKMKMAMELAQKARNASASSSTKPPQAEEAKTTTNVGELMMAANVGETEAEARARKMQAALELAKKARSGTTSSSSSANQAQTDEVKMTTTGVGGTWSGNADDVDSHKPKVGSWGVFERPADISKAYGGGRKVGVGGYEEPDDVAREKQQRTAKLLDDYRKSSGIDKVLEQQHEAEIREALVQHEKFMRNIAITKAVQVLENVTQYTSYKSELGGRVYLNLALAYEAQGERNKAKNTYTKLLGNGDSTINSRARELLYGFEAMEFMKVNATFSKEERKVMSFELPDFTRNTKKKYDMSYFDPDAARKKKYQQAGSSTSRFSSSDGAGQTVEAMESGAQSNRKERDVVIIGSGVAGLSCAALLARYGYSVLVLESHYHAGGAAHSFEIKGKKGMYKFDSGPSLYSGLSVADGDMKGNQRCVNPLKQVLDAIGEHVECINYDTWGVCLPEGDFPATVGSEPFQKDLLRLFPGQAGQDAVEEWKNLQAYMTPLAAASVALPPAAIRFDIGLVATLFRYLPNMVKYPNVGQLIGPYSNVLNTINIKNKFIRNWLDMLCFLLSGLPADGTITAEVAFMFAEWYRPGVQLDYPKGGSEGIINALIKGIRKYGGEVVLRQHVEQILVENGEAKGVKLKGGEKIFARKAVVSNAALKNTVRLLADKDLPTSWKQSSDATPECPSFVHLHLGFSADRLKEVMGGKDLECHYMVVNDWDRGVDAEQNLVLISIPSVLDPSLAPEGMHSLHAYVPATERYDIWKGVDRGSEEYKKLKEERSQVLWKAVERVIPDIRQRCDVQMVGTPLTHERFLRRHRGSYGPAIKAGQGVFPGPGTPIKNLLLCGDSVFPGIGMPAVAASGMIAANSIGLETLSKHQKLLDEISV